jgi:HSP20 family protein
MLTHTFLPSVFRGSLRPWNGFGEFGRLHDEVSRLFSTGSEFPALNAWSNDEETIVKAELPGFEPENIEISVEGNTLSLRGEREAEELKDGETYYRRERWNGKFARSLKLPAGVDADKVEAEFSNGLLSIKLPRAEAHKPRKIPVKAS